MVAARLLFLANVQFGKRLHCPGSFTPLRYQRRMSRWDTAGRTAGAVGLSIYRSTATAATSCRTSGKEELLPAPPPLRTGRALCNDSGSSIGQGHCLSPARV